MMITRNQSRTVPAVLNISSSLTSSISMAVIDSVSCPLQVLCWFSLRNVNVILYKGVSDFNYDSRIFLASSRPCLTVLSSDPSNTMIAFLHHGGDSLLATTMMKSSVSFHCKLLALVYTTSRSLLKSRAWRRMVNTYRLRHVWEHRIL